MMNVAKTLFEQGNLKPQSGNITNRKLEVLKMFRIHIERVNLHRRIDLVIT